MTGLDTALPLTVLIPETTVEPIVMFDGSAALKFAVVERTYVQRLGEEFDRPGNYVLLDIPDGEDGWSAYVGKASPGGVRSRLMSHMKAKDHWRRALIIQRDTTHAFNSAQVAWLEGRLYDLLDAAELATLHNGNRPSDETLPAFERAMLEACILPISRVLRLLGHDPATSDDNGTITATVRTRTSRFYGITVSDLIDAGYLTPGVRLTSTNSVWPAEATLNTDGTVRYNDTDYPTPSAAAGAVKDGPANGWDFWASEDTGGKTTLATLRARYTDQQPQPPAPPATT